MKYSTKDSEIYIVATPTDKLLQNLTDYSLDISADPINANVLSSEWAYALAGSKSASGSMSLLMDSEDENLQTIEDAVFEGKEISFKFYPAGKTTGSPCYAYSAFLTSFSSSAAVNSAVSVTVAFTVNGAVTHTTVSE